MDVTNTTFPLLEAIILPPLIENLRPLLLKVSYVFGGIFGLYVILLASKTYYERKKMHLIQKILFDLDQLNHHFGLPVSNDREGMIKKLIKKFQKKGQGLNKPVSKKRK